MDLQAFSLFLAVYRARSFADVARARGVAASTVSRSIAALETEMGLRLFHRTTRSLSPTEAGQRLFARLDHLVDDFSEAVEEARAVSHKPRGTLRVSCSSAFGELVLAPSLSDFCQAYPHITLNLSLSDRRIDLIDGQFDLAIRHGPLPSSDLIVRALTTAQYHLVASPDYLAVSGPCETPDDLRNHRVLTFDLPAFRGDWRFERGGVKESVCVRPRVMMSGASALLAAVRAGAGLSLLADWTTRTALASGAVVRVLPAWRYVPEGPVPQISMIMPSRRFIPQKVRAFQTFLSDLAGSARGARTGRLLD